MATNYYTEADKLIKKQEEEQVALGEKKKEEVNTQLDQQIAKAESDVQLKKGDLQRDYEDIVDATAIQKELDRRQIAETMANLGLTRSGLNASQQMAVELSAGNKTAAAQRQRQAAVDSLTRSLAEYKMEVENTRRESMNSIDEGVQSSIAQYRADRYKEATDATSADHKATLDYNYKMTELGMKQAENEDKEGKRLINKAFRLASIEEGKTGTDSGGVLEYFDTSTNSVARISRNALIYSLVAQEGLKETEATELVNALFDSYAYNPEDARTKGINHNYTAAKTIGGATSTYNEILLNAMSLPKTPAGVSAYNKRIGAKVTTPEEAREDYAARILNSGLSAEEISGIFNLAGFSQKELKTYVAKNNAAKAVGAVTGIFGKK